MAALFRVRLRNKIANGRAVGNDYIVERLDGVLTRKVAASMGHDRIGAERLCAHLNASLANHPQPRRGAK